MAIQDPYKPRSIWAYQPKEYNPRGDMPNGSTGALTPASQSNAVTQRAGARAGGANPFESMLAHSQALRAARNPAQPRFPPAAAMGMPRPGGVPPQQPGGIVAPQQPGNGGRSPDPSQFRSTALESALSRFTDPHQRDISVPPGQFIPPERGGGQASGKGGGQDYPPLGPSLPPREPPPPQLGGDDGRVGIPPRAPGVPSGPFVPPPTRPPLEPGADYYKTKGTQREGAGPVPEQQQTPQDRPRFTSMSSALTEETEADRGRIAGQPEPIPPGTSADAYNRMVSYATEDPRYDWLVPNAWVWDEYVAEATRLAGAYGEEHIDFIDWLHNRFPGDSLGPNPLYMTGRRRSPSGQPYDSYTHMLTPDGQIVPRTGNQGGGNWFDDQGNLNPPDAGGPPPPTDARGMSPSPAGEEPPQIEEPPPAEQPPPPSEGPPPQEQPPPIPPVNEPPPAGQPPPVVEPPIDAPPPAPYQEQPFDNSGSDVAASIDRFVKGIAPYNTMQQEALARQLRHQFGVSGMANSGGSGEAFGKSMSGLLAEQGKEISEKLFGAEQSALDRQLQKYISDQETRTRLKELETTTGMQKYMADLDAALRREQIQTNADLERSKLDLEKYGIDKNEVLERYKADLQLAGIKYSAGAQVDAARFHAAAARAGANASANAARLDAEVRRELGILGYDIQREGNLQDFLLGLAQLGPEWAKLIFAGSGQNLLPGQNPPGTVVIHP